MTFPWIRSAIKLVSTKFVNVYFIVSYDIKSDNSIARISDYCLLKKYIYKYIYIYLYICIFLLTNNNQSNIHINIICIYIHM